MYVAIGIPPKAIHNLVCLSLMRSLRTISGLSFFFYECLNLVCYYNFLHLLLFRGTEGFTFSPFMCHVEFCAPLYNGILATLVLCAGTVVVLFIPIYLS